MNNNCADDELFPKFSGYVMCLERNVLESIMEPNLIEGSHELGTKHKILYHYCSLTSFFSIINSNCFWLSYPKFMNDLSEYKNSKEVIIENLEKCKSNSILNLGFSQIVEQIIEKIKSFDEDPGSDLEYKKYDFCISFTSENDSLPMWCGYTGKDVGVSIGLNFADSKYFYAGRWNLFEPKPRGRFVDLIYDNNKLARIVKDYFDGMVKYYNTLTVSDRNILQSRFIHEMVSFYLSCTYYFKNSNFEYEKETRFTYSVLGDTRIIKYRVKNNFIVPYMEYPPLPIEINRDELIISRNSYSLPIISVMISPNTEEPNMVLDSIKAYLHSHGYDVEKIHFGKSKIPFKSR